jgi:hypothetical protein
VRCFVCVLTVGTGIIAGIAAVDEMIRSAVESLTTVAGELICIETLGTIVVTENTCVIGNVAEIAVWTIHHTRSTLKVVVDDTGDVNTVGAVSGVITARKAGLVTLLAAVVQG